jgi:hypothetical protein
LAEKDSEIQKLRAENERLRKLLMDYLDEFRLCRFCANIHADCSPTDGSCKPKWRGL